ncbi:hypothetical protein PLESTB_001238600 [Pleodorina starrii]|uniref:Uncharacterized protein n=1 Tax=Pleodorina starrii TaxID=330485 RepID=A0A9W6BT19_9CHLO|nr:hypothetical protein PLESTM_000221200 [Pleodorina starrii]GLC57543.1 hypothetical protein PLESTB_001238600 [Pleodorina starrii]
MASAQIPKLSERLTHVAGKLPVEVLGYDPSDDVDFSVQKSLRAELKELRRVESMDDAELDLMEAQLSEQQRQLSLLQQQRAAQPQPQPQPQPQAVAGAGAVVHPQAQARATAQAQGNQQRPAPAQPLSNTGPRPFTAPFWPRNELQGGVPAALPPPQHTLSVGLIPLPAPALQGPAQGVTGPPPGPPLARVPAQQVPIGGLVAAAGLAGAALAPVLPVPESSLQPAALQGCAVDQYGQYRQYGQYGQEPLGLSTALPPCGRDGPQPGQTWAERVQVGIQPGLALRDQVGVRGCGVGT